ncbi:DUF6090 family protein [Kordia jejudonensis]|uniref:DUF6090 family protein n=1 Tax=Kordia jejudonensis TaxID=1348245 RepID=UPI0006999EC8|nr:DUF6090 family protein [Kordia jejudonensis]
MLKFFRSIRQNLITQKKFKNYILYAIGEILLVMIGILLALQVNNWNEHRKTKDTLKDTLKTIAIDLKRDTIAATQLIKIIEVSQETSEKIIDKVVNPENFNEFPRSRSLVTLYQPFNIQTKGFDILKRVTDAQANEKDSLFSDLTQFYALFIPNIDKSNERLEKVVLENLDDFKAFPWFVDWAQGSVTDEMILYFSTSEDYRKRVAAYNVLAYGNHLLLIKSYKENAKIVLERIEKRLNED